MTFGPKSLKLNSRPVYCSRLYGIHYSHFAIYRPSGVRATNITQNLIQRNALYFHLVKRNTLLCYSPSQTQKKSCYSPVHIVVFVHVFSSTVLWLPHSGTYQNILTVRPEQKLKTRKILQGAEVISRILRQVIPTPS